MAGSRIRRGKAEVTGMTTGTITLTAHVDLIETTIETIETITEPTTPKPVADQVPLATDAANQLGERRKTN
jgi:hypothetical protein